MGAAGRKGQGPHMPSLVAVPPEMTLERREIANEIRIEISRICVSVCDVTSSDSPQKNFSQVYSAPSYSVRVDSIWGIQGGAEFCTQVTAAEGSRRIE